MAKARKGTSSQGLRKEAAEALRNPFLYGGMRNPPLLAKYLHRIAMSQKMRQAWIDLEKYEMRPELDKVPPGADICQNKMEAFWFLRSCAELIDNCGTIKVRAPAEHRRHYKNLAHMARTLAAAVDSDGEFKSLVFIESLKSVSRQFASKGASIDVVLERMPRTSVVLKEIADAARTRAELGPIFKQPQRAHAQRNYFIVCLSRWLGEFSAKPSHTIVAAAASAAFGGNVTNDVVRKLTERASRGRLRRNID